MCLLVIAAGTPIPVQEPTRSDRERRQEERRLPGMLERVPGRLSRPLLDVGHEEVPEEGDGENRGESDATE